MTTNRLLSGFIAAGLLLSACGGSDDPVPIVEPAAPAADVTDPAPAETSDPTSAVSATIGNSDLGEILAGDNGLTLYGFTNDVDAASTCSGTCADAWPPVIVDEDFTVAPGLDVGIFATTVRDDGQHQLVAGKWPLYFFAGDAVPGDLAGQGSGDVWFAVGLDGVLITDAADAAAGASDDAPSEAAAALVTAAETDLGEILVDADGLSLYGFTNDVDGVPSCNDACADAWPPIIVDDESALDGLDTSVFSVATRADGSLQLVAGVWPLYLFAGDGEPGDINGQASGDVWFLATPDGGLIRGDEPASTGFDY